MSVYKIICKKRLEIKCKIGASLQEKICSDEESFSNDAVSVSKEETEAAENEPEEDSNEATDDITENCGFLKSKWENDTTTENLARLDGTSKLMTKRKATMEDFLQMDDWEPPKTSADGKKRVRWADIEEKRTQDKMRAIGFVVGQTDWKRMMDPNAGQRALNQTKYIERVNKRGNAKKF